MFRLNRLTDYGVVVLSQMSRNPKDLRTAPQISQETGVPLPTVAKLLNALAHGHLIESHRGAAGGYTLKRAAAEFLRGIEVDRISLFGPALGELEHIALHHFGV